MDQALIMPSIVLPMVHEFVQPLVLPAVPAVSLSRFRRAPSAVLGEFLFFFKQKTAYEIMPSLVGSEMCIRDRSTSVFIIFLSAGPFPLPRWTRR